MSEPTIRYNATGRGIVAVDVDRLIASRLLAQANSGGGKSRAIRQLLEETHGRVQHLVLDPEGEFATLREKFGYVLAAGKGGDVEASVKTARLLCRRLMELGASAVIDLYDVPLDERKTFVRLFLEELMTLPRELWRPLLVVIDEAHKFVPERGHGESEASDAVITLCTQGRKRGYCAVLATQRISKLHKDAAAELLNKLIGRTGLDVDVKRAGDELGFDKEERAALKHLKPGEFFVYGPAIAPEVCRIRTGDVKTTHPEIGGGSGAAIPPAPSAIKAMLAQLADLPKEAEEEARSIDDLKRQIHQLKTDLRRTNQGTPKPVVDNRAIARAVDEAVLKERRTTRRTLESLQQLIADIGATAVKLPDRVSAAAKSCLEAQNALDLARAIAPSASPERLERKLDRALTRIVEASTADISGPQQRMLNALATMRELTLGRATRVARNIVAALSGQSPRSSGWDKNCSTLRSKGLVSYPDADTMALTDAGATVSMPDASITSLADLHAAWHDIVSGPQWRMIEALVKSYPDPMDRSALAAMSQQSSRSSGWDKNLSTLRSLGLLDYPSSDTVVATSYLFPEGLV